MDSEEFSLSITEWHLLSAIWDLGNADAADIAQILRAKFGRDYSTKSTSIMLSRLAGKGLLQSEQVHSDSPGRPAYLYSPAMPRNLAIQRQFKRFLRDHYISHYDFPILQEVMSAL